MYLIIFIFIGQKVNNIETNIDELVFKVNRIGYTVYGMIFYVEFKYKINI